jgi:hypothetical protein
MDGNNRQTIHLSQAKRCSGKPGHLSLAYNLANFLRTLALPVEVEQWSMTTLRDRLVKIGAKIVRHSRSITFQMAEVMVPRGLFEKILSAIAALRPSPPAQC